MLNYPKVGVVAEKQLLHTKDDITLEELQKHLRIEEKTSSRDTKKNSHDSSKVNVVEANKFHKNFKVKNDKKFKKKYGEG